jgi:hypothetical protein
VPIYLKNIAKDIISKQEKQTCLFVYNPPKQKQVPLDSWVLGQRCKFQAAILQLPEGGLTAVFIHINMLLSTVSFCVVQ